MKLPDWSFRKFVFLILGIIVFIFALFNFSTFLELLKKSYIIIKPLILGVVFAFLLNIPMSRIEKRFFKNDTQKKWRPISLFLSLIIVIIILLLIILIIIPQLAESVIKLVQSTPGYIQEIRTFLQPYTKDFPEVQNVLYNLQNSWSHISQQVTSYVTSNMGVLLDTTTHYVMIFIDGVSTFFMSIIFATFILLNKEQVHQNTKNVLQAYCSGEIYHQIASTANVADQIFTSFVIGTCLESVLEGSLFYIILFAGQFEYSLMIVILLTLLSLVPIIGKSIFMIIGFILILISQGIVRSLIFLAIFIVVDQLFGMFIHPKIVSNSLGLPPIWTFVAATVGAKILGLWGIFLCIPLASLAYTLISMNVNKRLIEKNLRDPSDKFNKFSFTQKRKFLKKKK